MDLHSRFKFRDFINLRYDHYLTEYFMTHYIWIDTFLGSHILTKKTVDTTTNDPIHENVAYVSSILFEYYYTKRGFDIAKEILKKFFPKLGRGSLHYEPSNLLKTLQGVNKGSCCKLC